MVSLLAKACGFKSLVVAKVKLAAIKEAHEGER